MFDDRLGKRKYHAHKGVAKQRKIDFDISYEDWKHIWIQSGKWEKRGNKKGQFVMSRYNDLGSYTVQNVYIQSFEDNVRESFKGKKKTQQHISNWRQSWYKNKQVANLI